MREYRLYAHLFSFWHVLHIPLFFMLADRRDRPCHRGQRVLIFRSCVNKRTAQRAIGIAWMTALSFIAAPGVFAASVETLLMPGKVTRAHVKQEENCANCHDRTNVRKQSALCLDCHKDIAADVRRAPWLSRPHGQRRRRRMPRLPHRTQGPRGRHRAARPRAVRSSSDRLRARGRACRARLRQLPQAARAHGARRPRPASAATRSDDVHRGQFTQSCGECHSAKSWTGGQVRSRQDGLQADRRARDRDLRCLPHRRPLQADPEDLHRLPCHGRRASRHHAAPTAASATSPRSGRRRSSTT